MDTFLERFCGAFFAVSQKKAHIFSPKVLVPPYQVKCCPIYIPWLNILFPILLSRLYGGTYKQNPNQRALEANSVINVFLSAFEMGIIFYNLFIIHDNWGIFWYIFSYVLVVGIKNYFDADFPVSLHPSIKHVDKITKDKDFLKEFSVIIFVESLAGITVNLIYFSLQHWIRGPQCFDLDRSTLRVPVLNGIVYEMLGTLVLLLSVKLIRISNLKRKEYLELLVEMFLTLAGLESTGAFYYPSLALAKNLTSKIKFATLIYVYILAPIAAILTIYKLHERIEAYKAEPKKKSKKEKTEPETQNVSRTQKRAQQKEKK